MKYNECAIFGVKVNTQVKSLVIVLNKVSFVIFCFFLLSHSRLLPIKAVLEKLFISSTLGARTVS